VSGYVVDASVAIKWFLPETHSETALRLQHLNHRPHAPAFVMLELGNILTKKIRRNELTQEEGKAILQDLKHIPLQRHSDMQLFRAKRMPSLDTCRSLYDCLCLVLAEVVDGKMVTADRKFYDALAKGPYAHRIVWVENFPSHNERHVSVRRARLSASLGLNQSLIWLVGWLRHGWIGEKVVVGRKEDVSERLMYSHHRKRIRILS
jgi:predicted nucleic acid-binding protein